MKKLIILLTVSLTLVSCTSQVNNTDNNNDSEVSPSPTVITQKPVRPELEVVKTFKQEGFELELFWDGFKYLYYGNVDLPTPCHEIKVDPLITESFPEQVSINVNAVSSDLICIQVIENRVFAGEIQVSKMATFKVSYRGNPVSEV